uniref:Cytochrome P450 n=1 Tax=Oryza brachyantha TaxID=4533 RepID=A0A0U1WXL4_ORYBR|nr:cytochrome P450 [Oryza brachyantha]
MVILHLLLVFGLFCLAILRRIARSPAAVREPIIEVTEAATARRALVEYAAAFSNRPFVPFPVALVTGPRRRRSDSLPTVPYGPHWRLLRRNLTVDILHPHASASSCPCSARPPTSSSLASPPGRRRRGGRRPRRLLRRRVQARRALVLRRQHQRAPGSRSAARAAGLRARRPRSRRVCPVEDGEAPALEAAAPFPILTQPAGRDLFPSHRRAAADSTSR